MFYILSLSILTRLSSCIVFYTGGSNLMSPLIYSDFLSKFKKYEIPVYKLPFGQNHKNIIQDLHNNYENIFFVGHSSGCITLLNNCETIDNIILLDPVKTPNFKKKSYNHLKKVLFIQAEKSYKWSYIPPFIPFIPCFGLTHQDLKVNPNKIKNIIVKKYGHSDILNNPYRNLMHYSRISIGNSNRKNKYIDAYHNFVSQFIIQFMHTNNKDIHI